MVFEMAKVIWGPLAAGVIALGCISTGHAATERSGFYTIIGPDGQMIVVDRNAAGKSSQQKAGSTNTPKNSKWSLFKRRDQIKPLDQAKATAPAAVLSPQSPKTASSVKPADVRANSSAEVTAQPLPPTQLEQAVAPVPESSSVPDQAKGQGVNPVLTPQPNAKAKTAVASAATSGSGEPDAQPITIIDGEQYIDSEYLEQREFNLEGKKRFYNLPDGIGGHEVLEREKGVDMTLFRRQKLEKPQIVDLSKNYQRIPRADIIALTGTSCFSEKQLKNAKLFKQDEPLDFWPRPGFEPKFDFVVAKLAQPVNDIQVTSYASSVQNPKFYWPLPIFLDNKGCVLEGVNAFYQTSVAPTVTMHQAIQGYLHVPQDTRYILFTPLEAAADLSEAELTNKGQVRLTPVR